MKNNTFIKGIIFLFSLLLFFQNLHAQCNDLTLTTQDEVDAFNCTVVSGSLSISGSDITNLNALSSLTTVEGSLNIVSTSSLEYLDGLINLTTVGTWLVISNNANLLNIDGLYNLKTVGSFGVEDGIYISSNPSITTVSGLSGLENVDGGLIIYDNATLTSINNINLLSSVSGNIEISSNAALTALEDFTSVVSITGDLLITNNSSLTSVIGFNSLASLVGTLDINSNLEITNLSGFSALTSISEILTISDNDKLVNLIGFDNLATVGVDVNITENLLLSNMNGLSSLSSIGGWLFINNNNALTNLEGLEAITSVVDLYILNNENLTDFCGLYTLLEGNGLAGDYFVSNNAENPTIQDILDNCGGSNTPPVAICQNLTVDAGENCEATVTPSQVNNGSYDPDDDPITLSLSPIGPYSLGVTAVTLTVSDGTSTDACAANIRVVDNNPPTLTCPENLSVYNNPGSCEGFIPDLTKNTVATDNCGTVTLSQSPEAGSIFGNSDGDTETVTITANDNNGNTATCEVVLTLEDNELPVLQVIANPIIFWPVNNQMVTINVSELVENIEDNCTILTDSDVYITHITSDEMSSTLIDIEIAEGCQSVNLRKSRINKGNGRVYTIYLKAYDENGNTSNASCQVHVPRKNGEPAIDDGMAYDVACQEKSLFRGNQNVDYTVFNYPNPFNGITNIQFSIPETSYTKLLVYNSLGYEIVTLFDGEAEAGFVYELEFQAFNLPNGMYFYRLQSGEKINIVKKMLLFK